MKKISILTFALIILSCSDVKETELIERLHQLESENKELKEKIENLYEMDIINTVMIPSFDKEEYNNNEKGKVTFKAHKYYDFDFPYNVHDALDNGENGENGKIRIENLKGSKFEYSFDLSEMEDNKINLLMVFKLKNNVISVPAKAEIKIKD